MTLGPGTRFGPYEIAERIGSGGMGEVYRATDTALKRDVAVKVLPESFASDKDRLARFQREAEVLASLNHSNIAQIFGLEKADDQTVIVMELIDGPTLADRIADGPLAPDEALAIARQVADALEAAHERQVVHRDLKPANVKLRPDGTIKILDFGIAKTVEAQPISGGRSPAVMTPAVTETGIILGTAAYMSPEQARGKPVDQRTDIWAFGCLLFEMLTGQPAFGGEDVMLTLARVLDRDTDLSSMPGTISPAVRHTIRLCLEKNPKKRIADIRDVRMALEGTFETGLPRGAQAPESSNGLRLLGAFVVTAVVAVAAAVAGGAVWLLRAVPAPEPKPVARFSMPLPPEQSFVAGLVSMIALSPDGTRIAYVASGQLYLRNLGESEARPVQGTAEPGIGAITPAFSPDGQWLAYVHAASPQGPFALKRVPITGGAPVAIHRYEAGQGFQFGLTWPLDDTILFAGTDGIVSIPANGGATELLVPSAEDERFDSPRLLPGGEAVLFTRIPGASGNFPGASGNAGGLDAAQVVVQSIGGNDRMVVWEGGSAARYLPTGHLVYAQGTALFALRFDAATRAVRGGPVPILEGLLRSSNGLTDTANYAVSDTGTLVMIPGDPNAPVQTGITTTLAWVDREGREEPLPIRPGDYTSARISPDGTKVALVVGASLVRETLPAIWIFDQRTENLSLLTANPEGDDGPVWSSDGTRIFFRSFRGEMNGVYSIEVDTGEITLVAASPDHPFAFPWTIAPGDRVLGVLDAVTLEDVDISTLSITDGEFTTLLSEKTSENEPSISPNGAWLAYTEGASPADVNAEINIRPFPGVSRTRIPVGRGQATIFSRDGSELFFFDGAGISAVPVTYEPTLRVGTPRRLFESAGYMGYLLGRPWDVDPSGERFLMIRVPGAAAAAGEPSRDQIDVVLNWFEELKSRVPVE